MIITSFSFENGERIPPKFTADADDISPHFLIQDLPEDTKSLVLICEDPDALKICGFTWIHWARFNIKPNGSQILIKEGDEPGLGAKNSYGKTTYGGPNPPHNTGIHNYFFKVYALNKELNLEDKISYDNLKKEMSPYILETVEIIGVYSRD